MSIAFEYCSEYDYHTPVAILPYLFAWAYNILLGLMLHSIGQFYEFVCLYESYIFSSCPVFCN
jgi:hypothetical protein